MQRRVALRVDHDVVRAPPAEQVLGGRSAPSSHGMVQGRPVGLGLGLGFGLGLGLG